MKTSKTLLLAALVATLAHLPSSARAESLYKSSSTINSTESTWADYFTLSYWTWFFFGDPDPEPTATPIQLP